MANRNHALSNNLDEQMVAGALRRLHTIANDLTAVNVERDRLYEERLLIVHQLRGVVSQQHLADACGCGVDMIKNIAARAARRER